GRSAASSPDRSPRADVAMKSLRVRAWFALAVLAAVMGLLLFVPAGTVHYWQAWVYLSIFIGASALTTLYLLRRDPALLERRMSGGPTPEKRPGQRVTMLATSPGVPAPLGGPPAHPPLRGFALPPGPSAPRRRL